MQKNSQFSADLFTFFKEATTGKLIFLCSAKLYFEKIPQVAFFKIIVYGMLMYVSN